MVNKRKVRLMARTSMYEKHEGNSELKKANYYKGDYVGAHMLLVGAAVTAAYLLCIVLLCLYKFEYIVNNLTTLNYNQIFNTAVVVYVVILIVYMIISYFVYSMRYANGESGIKFYINRLKKIHSLNQAEKEREDV